ncbi:hypothetical protein BDR05DRAFT_1004224 [Suillus weaverae]|nr:hypothetical protein BDR05DRAFT_1004224 [Suillus weaverae]
MAFSTLLDILSINQVLRLLVRDTPSPTRSAGAVVVVRSTGNTRVRSTPLWEAVSDLAFARSCPVTIPSILINAEQPAIAINQPVPSAATPQQSCARMSGAKKPSAERPPVPGACARSRTYRGDSKTDSGAFHSHARPDNHLNHEDLCRENTVAKKRVRPTAEDAPKAHLLPGLARDNLATRPLLSPGPSTLSPSPTPETQSSSTSKYVPYTSRQRLPTTSTTAQPPVSVSPQHQPTGATSNLQLMNLKAAAQGIGLDTACIGWAMLEKLSQDGETEEWAEIWGAITKGKASLLLPLEQSSGQEKITPEFMSDHVLTCDLLFKENTQVVTLSGLRNARTLIQSQHTAPPSQFKFIYQSHPYLRDPQVIELNPLSHVGYQLTHIALRGVQRYDEAIEAFTIMLSKLDDAPEAQIRDLRQQYVSPSEAEDAIRRAVWIKLENAPLRLLNTSTGLLCNRAAQLNSFKTSPEYKELLSFTTKYSELRTARIQNMVAAYFRCILLSHRWEEMEALLHDVQDKDVRELNGPGGIVKLQSFCKIARDAGYCCAWMDTCCIDKSNNTELQQSINSMFVWYRHSALTIVYLCDVPPSSQPGALARSDWSLYLDDRSLNHKESPAIMKELEDATGIDARALISFRPGMSDARQRLQLASSRVTTLQDDIAYSLFDIFGVHLPVIYGEEEQNALGRLLQEIVARSGDITVLDWIGQPSEFNSCLPAHITSYTTPPHTLPSLSEDHIHTQVSSLRQTMPTGLALKFYEQLGQLRAPRFANCRLHLPCISFRVTEVRRRRGPAQETPITYGIKADGLQDLLITTEESLVQFSRTKPIQQTFLLVHPWDRLTFIDDTESIGNWAEPGSMMDDSDKLPGGSPVEEEPHSRALRLMVRLGQPFGAFLLAQQRVGEYKRITSDHHIIAQVKDMTSVDNVDVGTVEIL